MDWKDTNYLKLSDAWRVVFLRDTFFFRPSYDQAAMSTNIPTFFTMEHGGSSSIMDKDAIYAWGVTL